MTTFYSRMLIDAVLETFLPKRIYTRKFVFVGTTNNKYMNIFFIRKACIIPDLSRAPPNIYIKLNITFKCCSIRMLGCLTKIYLNILSGMQRKLFEVYSFKAVHTHIFFMQNCHRQLKRRYNTFKRKKINNFRSAALLTKIVHILFVPFIFKEIKENNFSLQT